MSINWWLVTWSIILLAVLTVEVLAVLNHIHNGSLSEQVWWWLGKDQPWTLWLAARRLLFVIVWTWLTLHFLGIQFFDGTGL